MRLAFIVIITVANFTVSLAQSSLDSQLTALEYSIFSTKNCADQQELRLQKVWLYIDSLQFGPEVTRDLSRVKTECLDSVARQQFLWNAALHQYIAGNHEASELYFNRYKKTITGQSTELQLLGYLITATQDSLASANYLNALQQKDSLFQELTCLSELAHWESTNSTPYMIASAIIPGSGMMAAGYPFYGVTSMGIHTGIVILIAALWNWNVYFNAINWGLALVQKFYIGNIKLTDKLVRRRSDTRKGKFASDCSVSVQKVLERYPLRYLH